MSKLARLVALAVCLGAIHDGLGAASGADDGTRIETTGIGVLVNKVAMPSLSDPLDAHSLLCSAYDTVFYLLVERLVPLDSQRARAGAEKFASGFRELDMMAVLDDFCDDVADGVGLRLHTTTDLIHYAWKSLGSELTSLARAARLDPSSATEEDVYRVLVSGKFPNIPLRVVPNVTVSALYSPEHIVESNYLADLAALWRRKAQERPPAGTGAAAESGSGAAPLLLPQMMRGEWISGFWLARCGEFMDAHEEEFYPLFRHGGLAKLSSAMRASWFPKECTHIGTDAFYLPRERPPPRPPQAQVHDDEHGADL